MDLDKRILDGKRPLTCFDIEEAKKYVGRECYFTSKFENFENLSKVPHAILHNIDDSSTPFWCYGDDAILCYDRFILPCDWVKEEKPKKTYRPFSIEDWKFKHSIGDTIIYRYKGTYHGDPRESEVMYLGYVKPLDRITDEAGKGELVLGNDSLGLQNLFDNYEIWVDGSWKPFGIEEQL